MTLYAPSLSAVTAVCAYQTPGCFLQLKQPCSQPGQQCTTQNWSESPRTPAPLSYPDPSPHTNPAPCVFLHVALQTVLRGCSCPSRLIKYCVVPDCRKELLFSLRDEEKQEVPFPTTKSNRELHTSVCPHQKQHKSWNKSVMLHPNYFNVHSPFLRWSETTGSLYISRKVTGTCVGTRGLLNGIQEI